MADWRGLILIAARRLFHRWPPITSIVYWAALVALTLRGLRPLDELRLLLFLPLVVGYGTALQWRTWKLRGALLGIGATRPG